MERFILYELWRILKLATCCKEILFYVVLIFRVDIIYECFRKRLNQGGQKKKEKNRIQWASKKGEVIENSKIVNIKPEIYFLLSFSNSTIWNI